MGFGFVLDIAARGIVNVKRRPCAAQHLPRSHYVARLSYRLADRAVRLEDQHPLDLHNRHALFPDAVKVM